MKAQRRSMCCLCNAKFYGLIKFTFEDLPICPECACTAYGVSNQFNAMIVPMGNGMGFSNYAVYCATCDNKKRILKPHPNTCRPECMGCALLRENAEDLIANKSASHLWWEEEYERLRLLYIVSKSKHTSSWALSWKDGLKYDHYNGEHMDRKEIHRCLVIAFHKATAYSYE